MNEPRQAAPTVNRRELALQAFCGMQPTLMEAMKDRNIPNHRTEGCRMTPADCERYLDVFTDREIVDLVDAPAAYRFQVTMIGADGRADLETRFHIRLELTRAEFEDYQGVRNKVRHAIREAGHDLQRVCSWTEAPEYDPELVLQFRTSIGCPDTTQLIAYYPHSIDHRHYKRTVIGAHEFTYQSFSQGRFIKFAMNLR